MVFYPLTNIFSHDGDAFVLPHGIVLLDEYGEKQAIPPCCAEQILTKGGLRFDLHELHGARQVAEAHQIA